MFYSHRRLTLAARIGKHRTVGRWTYYLFVVATMMVLFPVGLPHRAQASSDCVLDPTFARDGKQLTDFFGEEDIVSDMVIQPDGKILLVGQVFLLSNHQGTLMIGLARYNSNGSPDLSFGNRGKVATAFGASAAASAVALQNDGKIVVAGTSSFADTAGDMALLRYNPDGQLDPTFGTGGKLVLDFFQHLDVATAVAIQKDGKIVLAGYTIAPSGRAFALARFNSDGQLDTTFDGDGKLTTAFSGTDTLLSDIALQTDGKIVAVGTNVLSLHEPPPSEFALARYNTDGSLDTTFDGDGKLTSRFDDISEARAVSLQADGKIVVAGRIATERQSYHAVLVRYNPDGQLDNMFDGDGLAIADVPVATDLLIQPDGKLVFTGYAISGTSTDFVTERYNSDGSPDLSFGSGGKIFTDFFCATDYAFAAALQSDGKIVVAGAAGSTDGRGGGVDFALARYNADVATAQPTLLSVTLSGTTVPGCQSLTGVVTLCAPAPAGGLEVKLTDNLSAATLPASVTVPEGASTACFTIATTPVSSNQSGNIVAKLNGVVRSATLVVRPIAIASLSFTPNPVLGPNPVSGTVVLECPAPAGGLTVQLSSRNPEVASPTRSTIRIPADSQQASFMVRTANVPNPRRAILTATVNGISKSAILTVQ
jgi:uncharacterized delta-60 repeat protein